ncbi:MAG: coproporphyrinogen III oxidase [Actinobacteria bacterium RBG_13_63_9]|nr:MAG: coproporphyrinogen III oxidase [Actinobacteria bacterium RBG_13_63_9]
MAREIPESYQGFEQGPIRPPSEAYSLLIRVTRNCPWNRCTFCPVYKGQRFSLRHVDNVKRDIDAVHRHVEALRQMADDQGHISQSDVRAAASSIQLEDLDAFDAAVHWASAGMESIFLQDADSLIMKPAELLDIVIHIKRCFPWVLRITSYARSHTLARIGDEDLKRIGEAGLNRIHVGLESASDKVLKMVKKGVTKQQHIDAGIKVKKAGIELSEYVMPGLGGIEFSEEHAIETADALNQINPHFIRLRTTRIFEGIELYEHFKAGRFRKCPEEMIVKEIKLLVEKLEGITSVFKSDHMNNLLEDVEGELPDGKEHMIASLNSFLSLESSQQALYFLGRGVGIFRGVQDMEDPRRLQAARSAYDRLGATPQTVEDIIIELRKGSL